MPDFDKDKAINDIKQAIAHTREVDRVSIKAFRDEREEEKLDDHLEVAMNALEKAKEKLEEVEDNK